MQHRYIDEWMMKMTDGTSIWEVGDRVKVARKVQYLDGRSFHWWPPMMDRIGLNGVVMRIRPGGGVEVVTTHPRDIERCSGYIYPPEALIGR